MPIHLGSRGSPTSLGSYEVDRYSVQLSYVCMVMNVLMMDELSINYFLFQILAPNFKALVLMVTEISSSQVFKKGHNSAYKKM